MIFFKKVTGLTEASLATSAFPFFVVVWGFFITLVFFNLFGNMFCTIIKCIILSRKWFLLLQQI